jgi:hypothetical protein
MTKPPAIGCPSQLDRILAKKRHEPEYASPAPPSGARQRRSAASNTGTSRPNFLRSRVERGCYLKRHGANHDLYTNPANASSRVDIDTENSLASISYQRNVSCHYPRTAWLAIYANRRADNISHPTPPARSPANTALLAALLQPNHCVI